MECRNVKLTLVKAQEFYNSGNDALREVALQAFTEDELKKQSFRNIKTFEDACYAIMLHPYTECKLLEQIESVSKASAAAYKLNIIRKALNKGQEMELTEGYMWYPFTPFVTEKSTYYNNELKNGTMEIVAEFMVDDKKYALLGGSAHDGGSAGLGCFYSSFGVGGAYAWVGFLGCASKEIAEHMSKYFAKEIFEAKYGDFIKYEWSRY